MAVWIVREKAYLIWVKEVGLWNSLSGVPILAPLILIDQKVPSVSWYDTTGMVFFDGWSGEDACISTSVYRSLLEQAGIAEPS